VPSADRPVTDRGWSACFFVSSRSGHAIGESLVVDKEGEGIMQWGKLSMLVSIVLALVGVLFAAAVLASGTALAKAPQSIAGSTMMTGGGYVPGGSALFCATAVNASTDLEWLDAVSLTFPSGWTPVCDWQAANDSCGNPVAFDCIAAGNNVSYLDNDGGYGEVNDGCSWSFCVTLDVPGGASGSQSVAWALSGDDYGDPPHDVNGAETIYQGGLLDGSVLDAETGGVDPTCTQATVGIEPGGLNVGVEPTTGQYGPVALATGTYNVSAWAPGYSVGGPTGVGVTSGMTTTQDFHLWRPVIEVAPTDFVSITAVISKTAVHGLTIANAGHQPLEFEIVEGAPALPWVSEDPISATMPGLSEMPIDVSFHCTEITNYEGALQILHSDPCQPPIEVPIVLHCSPDWRKLVSGEEWTPEIEVTVEVSDTIEIVDVLTAPVSFGLVESWDSSRLTFLGWDTVGGNVVLGDGSLLWSVESPPGAVTLTKWFHVESSTWTETTIGEDLLIEGLEFTRPVSLFKVPAGLWIEGPETIEFEAGEVVSFTLLYGNLGGYENQVMVRGEFPDGAPFVESVPPANRAGSGGGWAEWDIGDLSKNSEGGIEVTVATAGEFPLCARIPIFGRIHNHLGEPVDEVLVDLLHAPCHQVYQPLVLKNY
jgi:hypothetical protein